MEKQTICKFEKKEAIRIMKQILIGQRYQPQRNAFEAEIKATDSTGSLNRVMRRVRQAV